MIQRLRAHYEVFRARYAEKISLLPRKWQLGIILFLLVLILVMGLISWQLLRNRPNKPVLIEVQPGMTAYDIGRVLADKGIIRSALMFKMEARFMGIGNELKAGDYLISPNLTSEQILYLLASSHMASWQLTIPEGFTVDQIAELLDQKGLDGTVFAELARNYAPYEYIPFNQDLKYRIEGFLFPDTYELMRPDTEKLLLQKMTERFNKKFTSAMRERATDMGMSIGQIVNMAALIEREARLPDERPVVASVFYNRLAVDMPLQSCATIQYILGHQKTELSVQDTEIASPYNTYLHTGLPPGPIANPGDASIEAALYPAATDYLYFVVNGQGGHHFSRTYAEHLAAINQLQ